MRLFIAETRSLARAIAAVLPQPRRASGAPKVPGVRPCLAPGRASALQQRQGKHGAFWPCTRYPERKRMTADEGSPAGSSVRSRSCAKRGSPRKAAHGR